jgi:hypothetical protein
VDLDVTNSVEQHQLLRHARWVASNRSSHTDAALAMARAFTPALLDFSTGLNGALDEHSAEVSGTRPSSLNLKERGQARQAFLGSIVCLDDGSVHLVGLKNGVVDTGSGICLRLTPLAGGQAKQVYPAELAQSVKWHAPRPGLKGEKFIETLSSRKFKPRAPKFAANFEVSYKFAANLFI